MFLSHVYLYTSVSSTNLWNLWRQDLYLNNLSLASSSACYTMVLNRCLWDAHCIHNWSFHLRNYFANGITTSTLSCYYANFQPLLCTSPQRLTFLLFESGPSAENGEVQFRSWDGVEVFLCGLEFFSLLYFESTTQDLNTKICAACQNNHSNIGTERTK